MTFKELGDIHPQILEKCKERAIQQGIKLNLAVGITSGNSSGGFSWSSTSEYKSGNTGFWSIVLSDQNFDRFYTTYPKQSEYIKYISNNIYKASSNGKNYEITIKEI